MKEERRMLLTVLLLATPLPGDSMLTGRDVLAWMHDRYAATWYETLALVQSVTYLDSSGGVDHAEIWYESLVLPGVVRSDIAPLDRGRGEMFRGDSIFRFEADTLVQQGPALHVILLLGFDVYRQPVDVTVEKLERFGFDLRVVREDLWEGQAGWVVGADGGPQFWVDAAQLLLRRLTTPSRLGGGMRDVRFNGYEPLAGGWIATELEFLVEGAVRIQERYAWWDVGLAFAPAVFEVIGRARPVWVRN
jgi:hypothetical protein